MLRLVFGIMVVGLFIYIISAIRKGISRAKAIAQTNAEIAVANTKLKELDRREVLVKTRKKIQNQEKELTQKENKLKK